MDVCNRPPEEAHCSVCRAVVPVRANRPQPLAVPRDRSRLWERSLAAVPDDDVGHEVTFHSLSNGCTTGCHPRRRNRVVIMGNLVVPRFLYWGESVGYSHPGWSPVGPTGPPRETSQCSAGRRRSSGERGCPPPGWSLVVMLAPTGSSPSRRAWVAPPVEANRPHRHVPGVETLGVGIIWRTVPDETKSPGW